MFDYPTANAHLPGDITRRVFDDAVQFVPSWLINNPEVESWDYSVFKFPFVPGFHVCYMEDEDEFDDTSDIQEFILSTHKTLHEAMGVCRLLLANGGIKYV